jgi:protein phosphatase 2C family protein 2/3
MDNLIIVGEGCKRSSRNSRYRSIGSTAIIVLITETQIYVANAGDCRAVMCKNGKMLQLSTDHKPGIPDEKQRILKNGGRVESGRINRKIAVSRALGDFEYKTMEAPKESNSGWFLENHMITAVPEIKVVPMTNEIEFIILACDGVWDCKSSLAVV